MTPTLISYIVNRPHSRAVYEMYTMIPKRLRYIIEQQYFVNNISPLLSLILQKQVQKKK